MKWKPCRLGDVITLQRGHDLPDSQRQAGNVPVVSSSGITGRHNEFKAKAPGVVTGRYGTIGEVFYLEEDYWPLNTALYVNDFKGNNPRFAAYFLRNALRNYQSDKAAVPGVNRNVLHDLKTRAQDRLTQDRIAEVLSAYDALIENNRRRMELLEEAARQLYQEWFVRLRFPGHEHARIIDGVPEGWQRRPLAACVTFSSGGTPSKSKAEYWTGDIPWISSGEMTEPRLHDSTLHLTPEAIEAGSRLVPRGTILAVVRGMSLAKEFRIAMASRDVAFNQDLKALTCSPGVAPEYIFGALTARRNEIRDSATEASHGTKKLEMRVLESVPILIPTAKLRVLFVDFVRKINAQWDNLWRQNKQLRSARDLLLPRLMIGTIEV